MKQILDNSSLKEAGNFLLGNRQYNDAEQENIKKAIFSKGIDNLLSLFHALLVDDKICYIPFKTDNTSDGVKYLKEWLEKNHLLERLSIDKEEANNLLNMSRNKIISEIGSGAITGSLKKLAKNNEISIPTIMEGEIRNYFDEGLEHYGHNIGIDNIYSKTGEHIYKKFKQSFYTVFDEGSLINDLEIIIKNKYNNSEKQSKMLSGYWWAFISHLVRSEYYIQIANFENRLYVPLDTRKYFIKNLLEDDPDNEVYIYNEKDSIKILVEAFWFVLEKSEWDMQNFLKVTLDLKHDTKSEIQKFALLLKQLSEIGCYKPEERIDRQETIRGKMKEIQIETFRKVEKENTIHITVFDKNLVGLEKIRPKKKNEVLQNKTEEGSVKIQNAIKFIRNYISLLLHNIK